jgi:two-component system cell cycle sensor histidine kinase/response regulator CckA
MQIYQSEFQDQLVRGIAHRMNNILTLFHGYLGLLVENKNLDKQTLEGLAKIKEGASAASELMDRTHSLARPSTLVWREVQLADFIRTMKPSLMSYCGPRTKLELDLPNEVPPVWADAARVKTIIFELVRNALEATFGTGGVVKVAIRVAPAPGGSRTAKTLPWVSLTVADDGPGVPENATDRIFQPFFSTKKRKANAGLGLTVALTFIQHLGGILRSHSVPGKTEFEMLLPSRSATVS